MTPKTRNLIAIGLAFAVGGYLVAEATVFAVSTTPYSRGSALVTEMGCLACHRGPLEGAMPNPSRDPRVTDGVVPPLVGCEQGSDEFAAWVLHGAPDAQLASDRWQRTRSARALEMPAYSDHLDAAQVVEIRAWAMISAREDARPLADSGNPMARAEALAARHGCFACHGELGQGGVPNPGSLTGQIPGLVGDDFEHLTDGASPAAIEEWIMEGVSERFLAGNPLAPVGRYYMRNQATQMPAYRGILSDEEIDLLVEYCLHLHESGPLDADTYPAYVASASSPAGTEVKDLPLPAPVDIPEGEALPPAIAALFSEACVSCHGPKKQKSEYRMDTRDAAFNGGDIASYLEVKNVVPGDPDSSLLFTFITATVEDPENELFPMPPDEEDRLSAEQIELVREWIAADARWHTSQTLTSTSTD